MTKSSGYQIIGTVPAENSNSGYQIIGTADSSAAPVSSSASPNLLEALKNMFSTKGAIEMMPGGNLLAAAPGSANTFAKAAVSSTPNMLANLSHGIDTGVNALNNLIYPKSWNVPQLESPSSFVPKSFQPTQLESIQHPVAKFLGSVVGGTPLALATEGLSTEASPELASLKAFGKDSHLKSIPYGIAQGVLQGGLYSAPGQTASGTLLGGLLGGGISAALPVAGAVSENLKVDPAQLQANLDAAQAAHNAQLESIENVKAKFRLQYTSDH